MLSTIFARALPVVIAGALLAPLPLAAQQTGEPAKAQQQASKKAKKDKKMEGQSEQAFMTESSMSNLAETQLGQLAIDRSENDDVKALAKKIMEDHQQAEATIEGYFEAQNLRDPKLVPKKSLQDFTKLSQIPRSEFDMAFVNTMVKSHEKTIQKYEKWQTKATDEQVKSYIEQTLPLLQEHLQTAQQLQKQLKSGQTS